MTDSERDQIDQDAQIFMRTCFEAIRLLRNEGVQPINFFPLLYIEYVQIIYFFNSALNCVELQNIKRKLVSECVIVVDVAEKKVTSAQVKEHRGAVLDLIEMYLRGEFMQLIT